MLTPTLKPLTRLLLLPRFAFSSFNCWKCKKDNAPAEL